ncbi:glycosyltransferase family 4 protein [Deinococcus apachensis]|uniref:glycosyltransferase family 4 protein n=1 Tax=Deinococcus apachensis TaxID=309886 RepID=UPI00037B5B20|nr:glycosyltransferase family 4 protein [Deinococcus apachensis]
MRVLFVLEYFWPQVGGVETLFDTLARSLVEHGHSADVLTTRLEGTPRFEERAGVRIHRVGRARGTDRLAFTLQATPLAVRLARRADVIHTTTYNAAPPAWLAGRLARRPVVITVHEVLGGAWHALPGLSWPQAALLRALEYACVKLPFQGYVGVSRSTRAALRQIGVPDERLTFIYNGMDLHGWAADPELAARLRSELLPAGTEGPLFTYYGRPGVTKGVEVLIAAFERVRQQLPQARLRLILGNYPQERRAELERLALARLGEAVRVLPSVPRAELPSYLVASDAVVVPSLTEGFGFTAAEAAALGVPVVASDVGSLPEVLTERNVLVPPGDPQALAAGLLRVWRTPRPQVPPREFSLGEMTLAYEAVYRHLLAGRTPVAPDLADVLPGRS